MREGFRRLLLESFGSRKLCQQEAQRRRCTRGDGRGGLNISQEVQERIEPSWMLRCLMVW